MTVIFFIFSLSSVRAAEKYPKAKWNDIEGSLRRYFNEAGVVSWVITILKLKDYHISLNEAMLL